MKQISTQRATLYATSNDFCRIFKEDMQSLYLLALALTADPEKAEQCFVGGLEDCTSSNQVFQEWARSWARRVIVKNAVRAMTPAFSSEHAAVVPGNGITSEVPARLAELNLPAEISALLQLPAPERFAFVMSLCEGYSDRECALLLEWAREDLVAARVRALEQLGNSEAARKDLQLQPAMAARDRGHSIDLILSAPLATVA